MQRGSQLVDDNELERLVDLHSETDLREGCVPVSSCSSNPVSPPRIHGNFSSNARYNGRWSEKEDQIYFCIFSELMDINRRRPVVYLHLLIPYSFVTVELTSVYTTSCRED